MQVLNAILCGDDSLTHNENEPSVKSVHTYIDDAKRFL